MTDTKKRLGLMQMGLYGLEISSHYVSHRLECCCLPTTQKLHRTLQRPVFANMRVIYLTYLIMKDPFVLRFLSNLLD